MTKALPETCLNCSKTISEEMDYCPHCGQKNRKAKLPLKTFISDFFEDYFTVDAKFFQSIRKLVFAPGALTKEFNAGKRKTYIAPFRLYIFISFVFFFVLALDHKYNEVPMDERIIQFEDDGDSQDGKAPSDTLQTPELNAEADAKEIEESEEGYSLDVNFDDDSETSALEALIEERGRRANENPELFIQSMFRTASMTMFIMLPFFGFLLYLFHIRKRKYYVEHLVHSVHFHSFLFVILLFALIANLIFDWNDYSWIYLIAFIYLNLSLRASNNQSYFKSILKALFLLPIYLIFIGLAMIIVVVGAVLLT